MDIKRKIELLKSNLTSISEHRDVDSTVRLAALDHIVKLVESEREKIGVEIEEKKAAFVP